MVIFHSHGICQYSIGKSSTFIGNCPWLRSKLSEGIHPYPYSINIPSRFTASPQKVIVLCYTLNCSKYNSDSSQPCHLKVFKTKQQLSTTRDYCRFIAQQLVDKPPCCRFKPVIDQGIMITPSSYHEKNT